MQSLIHSAAKPSLKRNIKFIEYLIVKLYQSNKSVSLTSLSLYCDLSLELLDNKYFDRFKELAELQISKSEKDLNHLLHIFLQFKRISSTERTDYSEKLLDVTELVLGHQLNQPVTAMSVEQLRLTTVCLSIVTDLLEVNQILEH